MKNYEAYNLYILLKMFKDSGQKVGWKFATASAHNLVTLTPYVQGFEEGQRVIFEKYALKDENGVIQTDDTGNIVAANTPEFRVEITELSEELVEPPIKKVHESAIDFEVTVDNALYLNLMIEE